MPLPIFLHVPKTAGSSIRTLLTLNYPAEQVVSVYDYESMWTITQAAAASGRSFQLVQGHLGWGVHLWMGIADPWYFTFMRDPLARHLSDVAHAVRNRTHSLHGLLNAPGVRATSWADTGGLYLYYRNPVTQLFADTTFDREVGEADCLKALERVRQCRFVGLQEAFDASVLVLARKLGWAHPIYELRNTSGAEPRQQPTPDEALEIRRHLPFDQRIYEASQELFEAACRPYGAQLAEATEQYRELQATRGEAPDATARKGYLVGDPLPDPGLNEAQVPADSPLGRWMEACRSGPTW
jgi:hypothetical protein